MSRANAAPLAGLFEDFLPALQDFVYQPWTNWAGMFQNWFCPHITFGVNVKDKPVEDHVLQSVGSYGKQLSCIIDAISVLSSQLDRHKLTPEEQYTLLSFEHLKCRVDEAVAEFKDKSRTEQPKMTTAVVDGWINALLKLKQDNPVAYARLAARLKNELPLVEGKE